jgi:hypothetical protein
VLGGATLRTSSRYVAEILSVNTVHSKRCVDAVSLQWSANSYCV